MRRTTPATAGGPRPLLPPRFWARVARAGHRLLLLDYDGTLAPFRVAPGEARPLPGVVPLLRAIAGTGETSLAVVSGRPLSGLIPLLGRLPAALVAEHGWEVRRRDGRILRHPLPLPVGAALRRAGEAAAAAGWGHRLEHKRAALVLHTRGLPRPAAQRIERACARLWRREAAGTSLRLSPVDGGVELRASDRDKGTAVSELLDGSPEGTLAVYLGDDRTDEDAFRAVRRRGVGIRVGPENRKSLARGRILAVQGVREFLRRWLSVLQDEDRTQGVHYG